MMSDTNGKPESREIEAEQLRKLIELELAQKRVAWKQASARRQKIRVASFLFLFLLIVGSLFAFFLLFSRVNEQRAGQGATPMPSASPR